MITAKRFIELASEFPDAQAVPHMDRTAFRSPQRIYATLAADEASANLKLAAEQQELLAASRPKAFAPVPGGWGRMGWTTVTFQHASERDVRDALAGAHAIAAEKKRAARKR